MQKTLFFSCAALMFCIPINTMADGPVKTDTAETTKPMLSAKEVGEVEIREVLPISTSQRAQLAKLVATEPEARMLLQERLEEARRLLQATPRPLAVIDYEGLVNTDARRIQAVKSLEDMDDAAVLFEAWQATGEKAFAEHARRYLSQWATVYKPTGNDVNENKLLPLFVIYEAMRPDFSVEEREKIDAWVTDIALKQIASGERIERSQRSNRYTKTLRLLATIGLALNKVEWQNYAFDGFKEYVGSQLYADGSSFDLQYRDTLTYHSSALRPLLDLAVLAARKGENLYDWNSPSGSSLKKSVDYVVPYASGQKQRREWTNSKVDLDHKRAAAGLEQYRTGRLYEPKAALNLIQEAAFFDASLLPLVTKLADSKTQKFPTWRTVVNAAARAAE